MPLFDRTAGDVGNIVAFGPLSLAVPDQRLATLFYVVGLGLNCDPYRPASGGAMWVQAGEGALHLPAGPAQVLGGTIGLVAPDPGALRARLETVAPLLAGTRFAWENAGETLRLVCPWGNRLRVHAPQPGLAGRVPALTYLELDAPPGSAEAIARFYREALHAAATAGEDTGGRRARVQAGLSAVLVFREAARTPPEYDGHHIEITLADFSGPHRRLLARGLVTEGTSLHSYRFQDVVDPDSGDVLVTIGHDVRSMRHPR